jgi:hypothetical protein
MYVLYEIKNFNWIPNNEINLNITKPYSMFCSRIIKWADYMCNRWETIDENNQCKVVENECVNLRCA